MKTAPERFTARLLVDLRPALDGWEDPVAWGIGWDGAIYAAARRSREEITEARGPGTFPKSTFDAPTDFLILRSRQGQVETLVHRGEPLVVSFVQPFPGGVLLAGARCRWRPEGAEKNAAAIDWRGHELRRLTIGDGIQDLRVTREGTIWASYSDEGVFGNYGWSNPGPRAVGAPGLVAFSATGDIRFSYDAATAGTDSICDAYAMNLAENGDIWIYFYTEFPIVRIRQGGYRSWRLGVAGARALAVRGDRALLFGDYKRRGLGRVVRLRDEGDAESVGEWAMEGPAGDRLDSALALGDGERLVLFKDRQVLVAEGW